MTDDDDTTDTDDDRTVTVPLTLDKHRIGMWGELTDELGDDEAKDLLVANLSDGANQVVTSLYDNREQIAEAQQEFAANIDETEDDE